MHPALHGLSIVTTTEAYALGLDSRDLRRLTSQGHLTRIRRGVYGMGQPTKAYDSLRRRLDDAVCAAFGDRYVRSHQSAAIVLGLPVLRTDRTHLTTLQRGASRRERDVTVHVAGFDPDEVVRIGAARCLPITRAAIDIARGSGLRHGTVAIDSALRMGVTRDSLSQTILRMRRWPQVRRARSCLDLADAGSESVGETLARLLVWKVEAGRPETQFGLSDGHRTGFGDLRIGRHIIEFDGRTKYSGDDATQVLWEEKQREDWFRGFGLGFSRVTWDDCFSGSEAALRRLQREYGTSCDRFGTDISDLAAYRVTRTVRVMPT